MNLETNSLNEKYMLSDEHLKMLREGSGISEDAIASRGYRTVTDARELEHYGFSRDQRRVPGLLMPVHCTDGTNSLHSYRPDNPREIRSGKGKDYKHKILKYELPQGQGVRLDCPPACLSQLGNPQIPLWITEGQKKADALASRNQCVIALLDLWNFNGKNSFGGTTFLADWGYIALKDRDVRIVFDSDVMTKTQVRQALDRLKEHLERKGAHVGVVYLPKRKDGKNGVDDYLASGHSMDDLGALLEAPRPLPQAAAPTVELLDSAPPTIRRPLALNAAHGYAATWLFAKITKTEGRNRNDEIVRYEPPIVTNERRLFIVRDDGTIFGDGVGCKRLESLGIDIHLPEMPPDDKLWSAAGVKAYLGGKRPNPCEVFTRVSAVVNQFIDFDRSVAAQETMVDLIACYVLATWFLPAFSVIGYIWSNGDLGSGKTVLLHVVSELSYLGQLILAGGSYATLRDLADYGATLAFDDAENLADPRRTDPDKRTLLLAGNRRGSVVSLKEIGADKKWHTRYVNSFCARLFSATRLPDPILNSRAIVVPLVRTSDRAHANSSPLDFETWPCNRRELIDDLWALALSFLPEMPRYDRLVRERAELSGRCLEPWRSLLAVALFLQGKGLEGIFERMNRLSVEYQKERTELGGGDLTELVIRGLCH